MPNKTLVQQINREASKKNIPLSVFIELTHRCNLKCYYCYQKSFEKSNELTLAQLRKLFKELAEMGTLYLTFSGGEPFLRKDLLEILASARKNHCAVSIITNGLLINKEWAAGLESLGIMDVGVSFHAADEELHDKLSGVPGSFQKALNAVRLLVAAGNKVLIKHSVSNVNFGEYLKLQELADAEGCTFECDSTILPQKQGSISRYALGQEQHYTFLKDMDMKPLSSCVVKDDTFSLHCDAGRSICGIAPNGDVYPCIILPIWLGNLMENSFSEIWHGEKARQFRQQEKTLDETCTKCAISKMCSRCHAIAYLETNQWRGKSESLCDRAVAMVKLAQTANS